MTPSSVSSPGLKCQAARPRAGVKPNRARVVSRVSITYRFSLANPLSHGAKCAAHDVGIL